ncbi:HEAT repeat domain-containing protein [Streptomyces sp. NBC_01445]|uniref:HEAT repeat domain-containing protein n=1 Tax=Streptomyces sp. NBC_01445 TaxID=2903869 RepID=UPI002DDB80CA|nr:HEAT repeat domain-containing protein [Streptomyces sp. NBC_01445]
MSAVRDGDTALVKVLLHADSEPGMVDGAFRLAIRAYAGHMAQLLLQDGADASASRPEEFLSLHEAVDSGSPALVEALLDHSIRARYSRPELSEMRDLARAWHEAGVEAELRRRTGSHDVLVRTRVLDDEYYSVGEFTLGGTSVRDGHGAILTDLEELLGVRASFEELMARALHHGQHHSAWGHAVILLASRRDHETWAAAAALRTHAGPLHRLFGAGVLRLTHLFDGSDEDAFAGPALDLFTDWSAGEEDLAVLTEVLVALGEHADSRADAALLPYVGHPDVGIRCAVASGFGTWPEPPAFLDEVREALLVLMTDTDAAVRQTACRTVAEGKDHDPVFAHAMAALLDDADRRVQVTAAYGLALHDDERCVEAARRLPPTPPGSPHEHELDAVWRYEWRRDGH